MRRANRPRLIFVVVDECDEWDCKPISYDLKSLRISYTTEATADLDEASWRHLDDGEEVSKR